MIELARVLAGPMAGQTLADLGAEVIKIESPEGDETRGWGPPFVVQGEDQTAAYFHCCNRGKKSVVIDFKTEVGQRQVRDLVDTADILIENFKVGGLAKYGLDYARLSALNPRLIYCSITGFGQTGPYADRAGYDYIIQGMSGLMSVTGDPGGPPQKVGVAVTDLFTGLYACTGILAALQQRHSTGRGQHLDIALMDAATASMANQAMNYLATGVAPDRLGNAHPNIVPYQVFECADGHIIVAAGNDGQYRRFCGVLGLSDLAEHPDFATNAMRLKNRADLVPKLAAKTRAFTRDALTVACEDAGVPVGPINTLKDTFEDPQVVHRELQIDRDGVPGVRLPILFSDAETTAPTGAPALGADQDLLKDPANRSKA